MSRIRTPDEGGQQRFSNHHQRLNRLNGRDPLFRYRTIAGAADSIDVAPDWYGQDGFEAIRVPFQALLDGGSIPQEIFSELTYRLEISAIGLAVGAEAGTTPTSGGRIDGIAAAANTNYWIFAFLTDQFNGEIEGLGLVAQIASTGITMPAGATLGATGVAVTVGGAGEGLRYQTGARVLFRNGTASGSSWNQGRITATASTTITVNFDAALTLARNTNTTLANVPSVTAIQLDCPAPRLSGESDTYNDGQPYAYLGSIQTDDSSNIRNARKRGDFLRIAGGLATVVNRTGITASETDQTGLGNWLPLGAETARLITVGLITAGTPGNALVAAAPDAITANNTTLIQRAGISGVAQYADGDLDIRRRDCSYAQVYVETGTITVTHQGLLLGHFEENW